MITALGVGLTVLSESRTGKMHESMDVGAGQHDDSQLQGSRRMAALSTTV